MAIKVSRLLKFIFISFQFLRNYFPKSHRLSHAAKPARKQNLTGNSQSRSFKVMHFGITEKPTTDCNAYRHIITLASSLKYPKIASVNAENSRSRQPHCRLTPLSRGTFANIRINLIPPETRIIVLHFCRWHYRSIFIQIFVVGSERRIFSATECVSAV